MDETTQKNIEFLSKHYPSLKNKVLSSESLYPYQFISSPRPNILFEEKPFHSKVDPEKEALNLVKGLNVKKGYLFLFVGIGLGYHIEQFKRLYKEAQEATIIAIEKSSQAFTFLIQTRDISFLRGIHLFVDEDEPIIESFFRHLDPLSFKGYRIIRLRGAFSIFQDYYTRLETYFKSVLSGRLSDILTRFAFESLWMKNIVENIPSLQGKMPLGALKNILRYKTALVVAAGPSLIEQLQMIKSASPNIYIIAVDAALQPLLSSGILPDFIVSLDAQYFNLFHFHHIFTMEKWTPNSILIADVVANPLVLKHWQGPLYFSSTTSKAGHGGEKNPLVNLLMNYYGPIDSIECGGSVATTAIEVALYLGAHPVLVTGLDLSYTYLTTHINSSAIHRYFYFKSNRFDTIHSAMGKTIQKRKLQYVMGVSGKRVLTDFVFANYLKWFEEKSDYFQRVFNVTATGAVIPHVTHQILKDYINKNRVLKEKKLPCAPLPVAKLSRDVCMKVLSDLTQEICSAKNTLSCTIRTASNFDPILSRYPILKNILPLALSLYQNRDAAFSHVLMFLNMLEKKTERSIRKLDFHHHSSFRTSNTPSFR